jgi:tyrosine-protein kinase Etk/Wzc
MSTDGYPNGNGDGSNGAAANGAAGPSLEHDEISALKLAVPLVRRWPFIVASAVAAGLFGLLLALVIPARYTARTTFTVESASGSLPIGKALGLPRALTGLGLGGQGRQLGAMLGAGAPMPEPDYFTALAESRSIRESLLASRFDTTGGRVVLSEAGQPLIDLLGVRASTPAKRQDKAVRRLGRMLGSGIDRRGGIISITVTDRHPERAAAVANRLITLLDKHNVEHRRFRSRQQREFSERRLAEAQAELRMAEQRLELFMARNKRFADSPLLTSEHSRLQRAVLLKEDLAGRLTEAYDDARIAEAGDIPVVSVIDRAVPPVRRSFPVWWQFLLLGLAAGALAGIVGAYLLEARRAWIARQQPDFLALRDAALAWRTRLRKVATRA